MSPPARPPLGFGLLVPDWRAGGSERVGRTCSASSSSSPATGCRAGWYGDDGSGMSPRRPR